ncbi:SGNH/GDSL hydrolase family protein [Patescibacteria group bacterium]|nr:SGNH/GDSL hydrolase family protein [Patescibacteria group bacterium]
MIEHIKSIFAKIFLAVISVTLTLILLAVAFNLYLEKTRYIGDGNMGFTLDYAVFNLDYIFWQKYFCDLEDNCPETVSYVDSLLIHPQNIFGSEYSPTCKKILFLGDSFSTAPFSEFSYGDYFTEKLSEEFHHCFISLHLASGGVGNSQELAKLEDNIEVIDPDLVIWQFYWNDLVNNVQFSVHDIDRNLLKRKKAWNNAFFISGFLNQHIPFLRTSVIGNYFFEESTKKDFFRTWPADIYTDDVDEYNKVFVPLLLESGKKLAANNSAKLLTTISPLECYLDQEKTCDEWSLGDHIILEGILIENSMFISMESTSSATIFVENNLNNLFSNDDMKNYGSRHLSEQGEIYFGTNLFLNSKEIIKNLIFH